VFLRNTFLFHKPLENLSKYIFIKKDVSEKRRLSLDLEDQLEPDQQVNQTSTPLETSFDEVPDRVETFNQSIFFLFKKI
jgi:hypothetical protein